MIYRFLILSALLAGLGHICQAQDWRELYLNSDTTGNENLIRGVLFHDTGIIIFDDGIICKSNDLFNTYAVDSSHRDTSFDDIVFLNRDTGYISSAYFRGGMITTTDGGNTWHYLPQDSLNPIYLGGLLVYANKDTAYCNRLEGTGSLTFTHNGGRNWTNNQVNAIYNNNAICQSILRIAVQGDSVMYILCVDAPNYNYFIANLFLLKSSDYGQNWNEVYDFGHSGWGDLQMLDDTSLLVLTGNYIFKSTNSGNAFDTALSMNTNVTLTTSYYAFSFPCKDSGFAYCDGAVYKTRDAGSSWMRTAFQLNPSGPGFVEFICASSSERAMVGTRGGDLYITETGGGVYTGIESMTSPLTFTLYPDPTTGLLKITLPPNSGNNCAVEISDILGQMVYKAYPTNNQIDVTNLAPGIYLLRLKNTGEWQTAKFLKQ